MCTRTKIISTTTKNNKQQPKRLSERERVAAAAAHLSDAIVCVCSIRNDRIEFIWIENVYLRWTFVVWSVWDDANVFVSRCACVCVKTGLSDVQNRMWWYEHTRALWQKLKQSLSVVVVVAIAVEHFIWYRYILETHYNQFRLRIKCERRKKTVEYFFDISLHIFFFFLSSSVNQFSCVKSNRFRFHLRTLFNKYTKKLPEYSESISL